MKKIKNDVLLSVIILSYAQKKYIKDAIDSVLSQKVNFKYELLLADDCSNDGTLEIMQEYVNKYPDFIKILDRPKNMGASNNFMDACSKTKGKYLAVLEGDDYWIDDTKLQQQVDFLENNNDFICVAHLKQGRDLNNNILGVFPHPLKKDMIINGVEDYLNGKPFSSSTRLTRNIFKEKKVIFDFKRLFSLDSTVGDDQMTTYLASLGKVYVINKPMMVYRMRNNDGLSNYNSTHKVNDIEYTYLKINIELEKFFNYKYNFFKPISKSYTLGIAYDIFKLNFKDIKRFNKIIPKRHKYKSILLFPYTSVKILIDRFIRK